MIKDSGKFKKQNESFRAALSEVLGNAIRKPVSAKLGYEDTSGTKYIEVPAERTGEPSKYYFHEAGGTSFQGEAYLQPGRLLSWQIRYGCPIRIKKDELNGEWEIIGVDARYANQFFDGVSQDDGVFVPYDKMAPGMLTQTVPASMQAQVLSGAYRIGDEWLFKETTLTINWGVSPYNANIPTNATKAKYALVQLDFDTGLLSYKYGSEFPIGLTNFQVYTLDAATGIHTYLPFPDARNFRCGYIKLVSGMTRIIRNSHIWALQEYLAFNDSGSTNFDVILTDDDGNVMVDDDGHVLIDET